MTYNYNHTSKVYSALVGMREINYLKPAQIVERHNLRYLRTLSSYVRAVPLESRKWLFGSRSLSALEKAIQICSK